MCACTVIIMCKLKFFSDSYQIIMILVKTQSLYVTCTVHTFLLCRSLAGGRGIVPDG